MRARNLGLAAALAGLFLAITAAHPAAASNPIPGAPGPTTAQLLAQLQADLVRTYRQAPTYQAAVSFEYLQDRGRIKVLQTLDYKISFDRAAQRLVMDQPELFIVSDAGRLKLKVGQITERFLDTESPKLDDYAAFRKAMPSMTPPFQPDLALLMGDDLGSSKGKYLAPAADDPAHAPGLQFPTDQGGTMTVRIDPQTHMLRTVQIDSDPPTPDQPAGWTTRMTWRFDIKPAAPLEAKVFTFEPPDKAKAVGTIRALVLGEQQAEGEPEKNAMEGIAPPPLELKTLDGRPFKLADIKNKIVILDFWTTYCVACPDGLATMQKLSEWAAKEHKDLVIYTINGGETAEQAKSFLADLKPPMTLPVVMDPDGVAQKAYDIDGFPYTFVIVDGKVHHVYQGLVKDELTTIQKEINDLVEVPAPATTHPVTPAPPAPPRH